MNNQDADLNSSQQPNECVDLTASDDDDEIQVIPTEADVTRQVVYDAPSDHVADVINRLISLPESASASTAEPDLIQLDDDDDDDEITEIGRVGPSEDQPNSEDRRRAARTSKASQLIDWFSRLRKHHFDQLHINQHDYRTSEITVEKVVDPTICRQILEKYKKNETMVGLQEEFGLENEELLVVAICIAVNEKDNDLDINFNELCEDRIDDFSIDQIREFLEEPTSGVHMRLGPLDLMQQTILGPSHTLLALTMSNLRDKGLPCRYEPEDEDYGDAEDLQCSGLFADVLATSYKYACEPAVEEACKFNEELDAVIREIKAVSGVLEQNADFFASHDEKAKEILKIPPMKEYTDEELVAVRARVLTKEQIALEAAQTVRMNEMKSQIQAYKEKMAASFNNKDAFIRTLIIHPGDYCLARLAAYDDREMHLATVLKHLNCNTYVVKFCETDMEQVVDVRDMALTSTGIYDPVFDSICEIGLRVAVYTTGRYSKTKRLGWYSGTTAGRNYTSKTELLVFLDNEVDLYVSAPRKPGDPGYEIASERTGEYSVDEMKEKLAVSRMAVMVYQSADENGVHDRFHVDRALRVPERAEFIRKFVAAYPEYSLLRMPIGSKHTIYTSLVIPARGNREKHLYRVVDVENAFAHVRREIPQVIPGHDCMEKDCTRHTHNDEMIYRGSLRIEGIEKKKEMCLAGNSNLSRRRRGQFALQFEPSDPERQMPVRRAQQIIKTFGGRSANQSNKQPAQIALSPEVVARLKEKQAHFNITVVPTPCLPPLKSLRPHEQCGPDCLKEMDGDPYESRFHRNSPLHTPLLCGWRRKKLTTRGGKKRGRWHHTIIYYAPCGKLLDDIAKIVVYLRETRSQLTIDCFTFDDSINTEIYVTMDPKYVRVDDFASGIEGIPIPLVNSVDSAPSPILEYSRRRFQYDHTVNLSTITRDFCSGCSCEGDCSDASKCECQQLTKEAMDRLPKSLQISEEPYYINRTLHTKVITGQYECNDQCSCQRNSCHNRVVQNNIKYPMHIFKTAQSGWGLRALTDIPNGAFVCNYVGAMLTDRLADDLGNEDEYFADLDLKDAVEAAKMEVDDETDHGIGEEIDSDVEGSYGEANDDPDDYDVDDEDVVMRTDKTRKSTITTRAKKNLEKKAEKSSSGEGSSEVENERRESDGTEKKPVQKDLGLNWEKYFDDSALFVVDAKQRGNLGRFLNHSCDPNVHVQHVLYDTHDLRLPWVAFFTCKDVKAGDELCWDYRYTLLNEEVERLNCCCGAATCRRRLL